MPTPSDAAPVTPAKNPQDIGNQHADKVDQTYQSSGAAAARNLLMADVMATTSDAQSQAALQAEIARLQHDSATDHVLPAIAIDYAQANHLADGRSLTQSDIGQTMTTEGGTPQLDFKALMGTTLSQNMGDIKSGAWLGWLPGYQGINNDDLSRTQARFETDRTNANAATNDTAQNTAFANMLEANNGALFNRIAGSSPGIDQTSLAQAAADDDANPNAATHIFTKDQRAIVDGVLDRWNKGDDSINALVEPDHPDQLTAGQDTSGQITMGSLGRVVPAIQAKLPPAPTDAAAPVAPQPAAAAAAAANDSITPIKGEGDYDIAAQALGFETTQGTLAARRANLKTKHLTQAQNQELLALMKQLEVKHANPNVKDVFHFSHIGTEQAAYEETPATPATPT